VRPNGYCHDGVDVQALSCRLLATSSWIYTRVRASILTLLPFPCARLRLLAVRWLPGVLFTAEDADYVVFLCRNARPSRVRNGL
jgi:hypothetical protein